MRLRIGILVLGFVFIQNAFAQIGGGSSYSFLNLTDHARVAAIGGVGVTIYDQDVMASMYNPASLNDKSTGRLALSYQPFYAKIKKSSLVYGHKSEKTGNWAFGTTYINYGSFDGFDAVGVSTGTFSSNEYALFVTKSHQVGPYSFGITSKLVGSNLAGYNAFALMFDVGVIFVHPDKDFKVGLTMKNLGFTLKDYYADSHSSAPLDVQLGMSYKPEHMPLRLYINGQHFQNWKMQEVQKQENKKFGDELVRHFTVGGEFLISENFNLRAGYNIQRRKEMTLEQRKASTGFSFGAMIRIKGLEINYTKAFYHLVGGTNNLTLVFDINRMFVKKKSIPTQELN